MKKGFCKALKRVSAFVIAICLILTLMPLDTLEVKAASSEYVFRVGYQTFENMQEGITFKQLNVTMSAAIYDVTNSNSPVWIKNVGSITDGKLIVSEASISPYKLGLNDDGKIYSLKFIADIPASSPYAFIWPGNNDKHFENNFYEFNDDFSDQTIFVASTDGVVLNFAKNDQLVNVNAIPEIKVTATIGGQALVINNGKIPYSVIKTISDQNPLVVSYDASNSKYSFPEGPNGSTKSSSETLTWPGFGKNLVRWVEVDPGNDVRIWMNSNCGIMHEGSWYGSYNYGEKIGERTNATIPAKYMNSFAGWEIGYVVNNERTPLTILKTDADLYNYEVNATNFPAGREYYVMPTWKQVHNVIFAAGNNSTFVEKVLDYRDQNNNPVYKEFNHENDMGLGMVISGLSINDCWSNEIYNFKRDGYTAITNWYLYEGTNGENGSYNKSLDSNGNPITFNTVDDCRKYIIGNKDVVFRAQWDNEDMPDELNGWGNIPDLEDGKDIFIRLNINGGADLGNFYWNGMYNFGEKLGERTNVNIPATYSKYFKGWELCYWGVDGPIQIAKFDTTQQMYEHTVDSNLDVNREYFVSPIWNEIYNVFIIAGDKAKFQEKYVQDWNNGTPTYAYTDMENRSCTMVLPGHCTNDAMGSELVNFARQGYKAITKWYLYEGTNGEKGSYQLVLDSAGNPVTFKDVTACKSYVIKDKDLIFYAQWDNEVMPEDLDGWGNPYNEANIFTLSNREMTEGSTASIIDDLGLSYKGKPVTKADLSNIKFNSLEPKKLTIDENGNIKAIDDCDEVTIQIEYKDSSTGKTVNGVVFIYISLKVISDSNDILVLEDEYTDEDGKKQKYLYAEFDIKNVNSIDDAVDKLLANQNFNINEYSWSQFTAYQCDSTTVISESTIKKAKSGGFNSIAMDVEDFSFRLNLDTYASGDFKPVLARGTDNSVDKMVKDAGYTGKYVYYKLSNCPGTTDFTEFIDKNIFEASYDADGFYEEYLYVYKIDVATGKLDYVSEGWARGFKEEWDDQIFTENFINVVDVDGDGQYIVTNECIHSWSEWEIISEATCKKSGIKKCQCVICGATKSLEYTDADNHVGGTYVNGKVFATSLMDGYTGDICCKGCNKVIKKGEVISKIKEPVELSTEDINDTVNKITAIDQSSDKKNNEVVISMIDNNKVATVIPTEILEAAKGKDVDVRFDMNGYSWTINGKDIDSISKEEINLEVTVDVDVASDKVLEELTKGNKDSMQIALTHDGEFGFDATLTLNVGEDKKNQYVNLYWYKDNGEVELIEAAKVDEEGKVKLNFKHASKYILVYDNVDRTAVKPETPKNEPPAVTTPTTTPEAKPETKPATTPKTEDADMTLYVMMLACGFGMLGILKKKKFSR